MLFNEHRADKRTTAERLGKVPTTSVLRRSSSLSRSCRLLELIADQCSVGKLVKARRSGAISVNLAATSQNHGTG